MQENNQIMIHIFQYDDEEPPDEHWGVQGGGAAGNAGKTHVIIRYCITNDILLKLMKIGSIMIMSVVESGTSKHSCICILSHSLHLADSGW